MNPIKEYLQKNDEATVEKIADKLDVSMATVYSWMRGETSPSLGNSRRLANLLGMTRLEFRQAWLDWEEEAGINKYRR